MSTDGYMLNIASVLLDLCDPFLDNEQKVRLTIRCRRCCDYGAHPVWLYCSRWRQSALIDPTYPFRSRRLDWFKETRMIGTSEAAQEWAKQTYPATDRTKRAPGSASFLRAADRTNGAFDSAEPYQPNFITECFFLTATALHLSLIRVFLLYNHVTRELRELKKVIDDMTASRPTWVVRLS